MDTKIEPHIFFLSCFRGKTGYYAALASKQAKYLVIREDKTKKYVKNQTST
jgi:hypothetical protein